MQNDNFRILYWILQSYVSLPIPFMEESLNPDITQETVLWRLPKYQFLRGNWSAQPS